MAGNRFILQFLVLPNLHRERCSWLLRVRELLERSWKWRCCDLHAFLEAVKREIYLEHLIVLIKILIFGTKYWFSYRMEKNHDISTYRFIVPPVMCVRACIHTYTHTYIHTYQPGMVHRCHGSVRTSVRGSRFDKISVQQKKKSTMLGFFSFILNR